MIHYYAGLVVCLGGRGCRSFKFPIIVGMPYMPTLYIIVLDLMGVPS